ncbi:MAG: hypothetical protein HXY28_05000 [Hydrogenophilaceae bacterium]|jgi:hypothetical protein|nr:hypothetical protein [Hydrogenophilaceae bacterium]
MPLFRFEHHTERVAPDGVFIGRMAANLFAGAVIIAAALAIGMIGYHATERMDWLDSFLNAAMLLGGMGPVDPLHTTAGKIFAGAYALFCGLLIVLVSGIVLAPVFHRVLHALKVERSTSDN